MKTRILQLVSSLFLILVFHSVHAQWNIGGNDLSADGVLGSSVASDPWDLIFVTSGQQRMKIASSGSSGFGDFSLSDPDGSSQLEIRNVIKTKSLNVSNESTSNGYKYGIYNTVGSGGTGSHWGIYNSTSISTESAAINYGLYNTLGSAGTATRYGIYTSSTTSNASATSSNYGIYSTVSHSGNGPAYGLYSTVSSSGTGTHYGVYSSASGSSNYSFYGIGRGYFSENVGLGITSPAAPLHIKNVELDLTSGGSLIIGATNGVNMAFDANEIHVRNNSAAAALYLNSKGKPVVINAGGVLDDLTLSTDAAFRIGSTDENNLAFDGNEIQARSNGAASTLKLNELGGSVCIGTASATEKLNVCGGIKATEVRVETGWCDYVFDNKYNLRPLSEVAQFIAENKHLPNIPAATEVETEGLALGEMSKRMMEKIEELTLYLIHQDQQIQMLKTDNEKMKQQISALMNR